MKKCILWGVCCVMIFVMLGCIGPRIREGSQKVVETSGKKPSWITKVPKTKGEMSYFRGIKTESPTIEAGLIDSRMDAARQVSEAIQINASIEYQNARTERGLPEDGGEVGWVINDGMIIISEAVVRGLKEEEIYWERIEKVKNNKVVYSYNCFQLVSISYDNYKNLALGALEKQRDKARNSKNKKAEEFAESMIERIRAKQAFDSE